MGEIAVVMVAGLAILSLIRIRARHATVQVADNDPDADPEQRTDATISQTMANEGRG